MQKIKQKWYCRIAPSLGGGFAGTPARVWGVKKYKNQNAPTVFFGCYSLNDFNIIRNHKGRKAILWCGSDIRYFIKGYWLDNEGKIKLNPGPLAKWINKNCENYVENKVEYEALKKFGIKSKIVPSFLGDTNKFKPQKLNKELRYYSSVSGNDFKLYNWENINKITKKNPHIKFFLYGNTIDWKAPKNVIVRGRMSQKEMDNEIKTMTGAIRLAAFEGCSELIVKSVLWGQKPISAINYPFLRSKNPRKELLKVLNQYPWNNYAKV
ncbi:MAG: hypothetical protein HY919_02860 [Elusimicrobia bacterium]|nr:hypothetical protein [Elusimicrobiota bacterium]